MSRPSYRIALLWGASALSIACSAQAAFAQAGSSQAAGAVATPASPEQEAIKAQNGTDGLPVPAKAQESAATTDQAGAPVAATTPAAGTGSVAEIVVTGVRASILSANAIKRNSDEIVDSIVAQDIGKLPDNNVAEALQRISGIQITRNYGEGSGVAIRGLTQVQTEINGRDSFSANGGRGLNLEDVPSELLAGIDVYKDPSAEQIEGGIGGVINLRTRQPFDFKGLKVAASMGASYDDLAEAGRPNGSLLVSDRWDTAIGEIGLLVDASIAQTRFRQDLISVQPFYTNVAPVGTHAIGAVNIPQGAGQDETQGSRQREGLSIAMQWRPTSNLEFYSQYNRTDYYFKWNDSADFALPANGTIDASQPATFSKSGDFTSGSFSNVPVQFNASLIDTHSVTNDYSIGGKWSVTDRLTLSADAQYIYATNKSARFILGENGSVNAAGVTTTASEVGLNITNPVASITLPAGYASNPANFSLAYALDHYDNDSGTEKAIRSDLEYRVSDEGFLRKVKFGFRFTDRGAVTGSTPYNYNTIGQNLTGANTNLYGLYNYNNFYRGDASVIGPTVTPNRALLGNIRNTLGLFSATPVPFLPSDFSTEDEHTYAGYFVGDYGFNLGPFPVDGNVGVRVVNTSEDTSGFNSLTPQVPTGGAANADGTPATKAGPPTFQTINVGQNYTDALPSFNARIHLNDNLQLRLAASKGLTRPDFSQLNPNVNISQPTQTQINNNSVLTSGPYGSASLKPYRTNNFDISLEWFFNKTGSLTGALFYKDVTGFIATEVANETYYGSVFQVTRDYNQGKGTIKGAEFAYTQFLDFLPKPFDGLGVQANYTYVDSETPSPTASGTNGAPLVVPLQGLSRNSYNLVGIYEKGPIQARIAYNWRDKFIVTTAGNGTGALPVYDEAYGQLDGSISYNVTSNAVLQFEVRNITNAEQDSDFGTVTRPRDAFVNDRQFNAVMRVSY